MGKLVSVIVPVYNSEKYLSKCIISILNQSYKNLEIILVNDGSTDDSLKICNEFVKADNRIKLINLINGGASKARNIGINISIGDYLIFVDSDDWIESKFVDVLVNNIIDNANCLAACGWKKENLDGFIIDQVKNENKGVLSVEEVLTRYGKNPIGFTTIMYPKSLFDLSKVRFDEDASIAEDTLFVIMCLLNSEGVIYEPVPLYHIVQSTESITRSNINIKQLSGLDTYDKIVILLDSKHSVISNNFRLIKIQYATNLLVKLYENKNSTDNIKNIEKNLVDCIESYLVPFLLSTRISIKSKVRALMLFYFKRVFILYQKIKMRGCNNV